ncbi:hypothetical protein D3C80_1186330 [compost metagenome]
MLPNLSTLKSILPAFTSSTALPTSIVTVPVFGFGIKPRGPRIRPNAPTLPITEGIVIITSMSVQPPLILSMNSSNPTNSAPAAFASASLSGVQSTNTRTSLPVP